MSILIQLFLKESEPFLATLKTSVFRKKRGSAIAVERARRWASKSCERNRDSVDFVAELKPKTVFGMLVGQSFIICIWEAPDSAASWQVTV